MRTCQQAENDFLLDQRRQAGNQCRLTQQLDEPDQRIQQVGVEDFERDGTRGILAPGPRLVHLGRHLNDGADVQREHHPKKRFCATGPRDVRHDREIDGREHRLPRAVVDRLLAEQDLLVALRHHAETEVVDAVQGLGWSRPAVQGERRNAGVVVAVGLDKAPDGASQRAYRRTVGRIWPSLL